jgi:hypothetical protein
MSNKKNDMERIEQRDEFPPAPTSQRQLHFVSELAFTDCSLPQG